MSEFEKYTIGHNFPLWKFSRCSPMACSKSCKIEVRVYSEVGGSTRKLITNFFMLLRLLQHCQLPVKSTESVACHKLGAGTLSHSSCHFFFHYFGSGCRRCAFCDRGRNSFCGDNLSKESCNYLLFSPRK